MRKEDKENLQVDGFEDRNMELEFCYHVSIRVTWDLSGLPDERK